MEGVRSAASFEGLIILGVIYFVLSLISKAGKKKGGAERDGSAAAGATGTVEENKGLSLQKILREIQRAKEQAEQQEAASRNSEHPAIRKGPEVVVRETRAAVEQRRSRPQPLEGRGPLGRHSRTRLPAAEEVEERDSLDGKSLEVEERIENLDNRTRVLVDQDDQAGAIIQRRLDQAAARNREHRNTDHKAFDKRVREAAPESAPERRYTPAQMRDAFVWREILSPPKSLEE